MTPQHDVNSSTTTTGDISLAKQCSRLTLKLVALSVFLEFSILCLENRYY